MASRGRYNYALLTNKSGGTVDKGMSLIPDSSTDLAFTTTTTSGDLRIFASVADEDIADDALGLVQIFGSIVEELLTSAAVTRGHYIMQGTTAGKVVDTTTMADATTTPPTGSIGIALTGVGSAGSIAAFIFPAQPNPGSGGANAFTDLSDVPADYTGDGLKSLRVNAGETAIEFYTPATAVSVVPTYNPDLAPTSPSAINDEFDDDSLDVAWTSVGSPDIVSETELHGFVHIADNDSTDPCGIWKAYVPGAATLTVVAKVHYNVSLAGSNQVGIRLQDSGAANIAYIAMLNGSSWIAAAAALSGGEDHGILTYVSGDVGTVYLAITRDATTNYKFYISPNGINWQLVASCSQAGTIARVQLWVAGFATVAEGYFDFIRAFTTETTKIGNNP